MIERWVLWAIDNIRVFRDSRKTLEREIVVVVLTILCSLLLVDNPFFSLVHQCPMSLSLL
jgi:hypothetical protein|tara:strand:+ start:416 stop:595 length:180 start_codon:yes stop_codon:yes gene_type:complete